MNLFEIKLEKIYNKLDLACDALIEEIKIRETLPIFVELKDFSIQQKSYLIKILQPKFLDYYYLPLFHSETLTQIDLCEYKNFNPEKYNDFYINCLRVHPSRIENLIKTQAKNELTDYARLFINTRGYPKILSFFFICTIMLVFYIWWILINHKDSNDFTYNIFSLIMVLFLIVLFFFMKKSQNRINIQKMNLIITNRTMPSLVIHVENYLNKQLKIDS